MWSAEAVARRVFLRCTALGPLAARGNHSPDPAARQKDRATRPLTLFLCGDVMTGRGIDQVLPHSSDPRLYEQYMQSALGYVELAERVNGPIPRAVPFPYIWGDALEEFRRAAPDVRVVNLETSITTSGDWVPKGINYRMHPANTGCLTAAGLDCCVLANNHVLDWGTSGLLETLDSLRNAGLKTSGAGRHLAEAQAPAVVEIAGRGRVLVFAFGSTSSGIPADWAATARRPGVDLLAGLSEETVARIAARVRQHKRPRDIVVASIHWGPNWGYEVPPAHRRFARQLVDEAAVDIVHGHSSHHPMGIEVYRGRPILYGCGDFLNDYEGISGMEEYRGHLSLMYFLRMNPSSGELLELEMRPLEIRRFRLERASRDDARWLRDTLHREGERLGTTVELDDAGTLRLRWE